MLTEATARLACAGIVVNGYHRRGLEWRCLRSASVTLWPVVALRGTSELQSSLQSLADALPSLPL